MNQLFLGFNKQVLLPAYNGRKKQGYLFIDDDVPNVPKSLTFDPLKHSFNPLASNDYKSVCDFVDVIDAVFSRGESTLTKDTGLDEIAEAASEPSKRDRARTLDTLIEKPDRKASTGEIWAYSKVQRILRSPVLTRVLCSKSQFSFNPRSMILARINRAELGEFDALMLGLLLIARFPGQIVIPDLAFYARDMHIGLIRQRRLIGGCNTLADLPPTIRNAFLSERAITARGATYKDAETLAFNKGLRPDPSRDENDFNRDISKSMALVEL